MGQFERNAKAFDKNKMETTYQVFHSLNELVELYPEYTIAQHISTISRRKGPGNKEFYHLTNEELLKKIQAHKAELEEDQLDNEEDIID